MAEDTERAINECRKAPGIDPNTVQAMFALGGELVRASESHEALAVFERLVEVTGRMPISVAMLGWAYGATGKRDRAVAVLKELITRSDSEYVSPLFIAWVLSQLRNEGDPFEWLARAFEEKRPFLVFWRLPVFDALSTDPRFDELLPRLNLTR